MSASQVGFFSHRRRQRLAAEMAQANAPSFTAGAAPIPSDDEALERATRPDKPADAAKRTGAAKGR